MMISSNGGIHGPSENHKKKCKMTRKSKRLLPALEHVAIFLVLSCSLSEGNPTWLSQKMHENDDVERARHSIEGKQK